MERKVIWQEIALLLTEEAVVVVEEVVAAADLVVTRPVTTVNRLVTSLVTAHKSAAVVVEAEVAVPVTTVAVKDICPVTVLMAVEVAVADKVVVEEVLVTSECFRVSCSTNQLIKRYHIVICAIFRWKQCGLV